jgi:hypothetical protein
MKTRLFVIAAALALLPLAARAAEVSKALVQPAIDIQVSLASDKMDGVQQNAMAVEAEAAKLGAPAARIVGAAKQLEKTTKIQDARVAFGAMSEAILAYMEAEKLTPASGVRVAFCPMVKKSWLQQGGEIRNPYYGSSMLTCGTFTK